MTAALSHTEKQNIRDLRLEEAIMSYYRRNGLYYSITECKLEPEVKVIFNEYIDTLIKTLTEQKEILK